MLRLSVLLLALASTPAVALNQPVSASISVDTFEPMPISEVVRIVVGDLERRSYVLAPEILTDTRLVRFSLQQLTVPDARKTLDTVLASMGYKIRDAGAVSIVEKTTESVAVVKNKILVYEPRNRSVLELRDAVRAVVPSAKPLTQGSIRSPGNRPASEKDDSVSARIESSARDILVMSVPSDVYARVLTVLKNVDIARDVYTVRAAVVRVLDSKTDSFSVALQSTNFSVLGSSATSGVVASLSSNSLKLALSAVESDSSVKVVSMPSVRVSDGEQAKLSSGGRVPIRKAVVRDGTVSEEYAYEDVGARLMVTPNFFRDVTKMQIQYQDDAVAGLMGDAPVFRSLDLSTTVDIKKGQAVLLGGLKSASTDVSDESLFGITLASNDASENELVWVAVWLEKSDAQFDPIAASNAALKTASTDAPETCDIFCYDE
ncbi:MAG: hypothetical protein OQL06_10020 [Gammaproteobacteria bacterium]|nr:hypothetical protein [Gammaproteobacteria bacterium]